MHWPANSEAPPLIVVRIKFLRVQHTNPATGKAVRASRSKAVHTGNPEATGRQESGFEGGLAEIGLECFLLPWLPQAPDLLTHLGPLGFTTQWPNI